MSACPACPVISTRPLCHCAPPAAPSVLTLILAFPTALLVLPTATSASVGSSARFAHKHISSAQSAQQKISAWGHVHPSTMQTSCLVAARDAYIPAASAMGHSSALAASWAYFMKAIVYRAAPNPPSSTRRAESVRIVMKVVRPAPSQPRPAHPALVACSWSTWIALAGRPAPMAPTRTVTSARSALKAVLLAFHSQNALHARSLISWTQPLRSARLSAPTRNLAMLKSGSARPAVRSASPAGVRPLAAYHAPRAICSSASRISVSGSAPRSITKPAYSAAAANFPARTVHQPPAAPAATRACTCMRSQPAA